MTPITPECGHCVGIRRGWGSSTTFFTPADHDAVLPSPWCSDIDTSRSHKVSGLRRVSEQISAMFRLLAHIYGHRKHEGRPTRCVERAEEQVLLYRATDTSAPYSSPRAIVLQFPDSNLPVLQRCNTIMKRNLSKTASNLITEDKPHSRRTYCLDCAHDDRQLLTILPSVFYSKWDNSLDVRQKLYACVRRDI